ncbi:hypothetical protein M9H77_09550 [Catharanthus roseus]|uniref:Uncharacterized protein n=1 Tax=Catharanthus roseus TaxID=4058 RepID=A0ACC0C146_CATRO|nr:hypothetical protein M9H77_09550 [Catharanthus roseus]
MLGLGKTTLARKVFKHPTMEYKFLVRAFVEVSAEYKAKEVFLKILHEIGVYTKEMRKNEDDLIQAIIDYLKHSRILIITRNKPVAERARKGSDPYGLRFLYFSESQELLRKNLATKNSQST